MDKTGKIKVFAFLSLDGYVPDADQWNDLLPEYSLPMENYCGLPQFRDSADSIVMTGIYFATLQAADTWPFSEKMCYILTSRSFSLPSGINAELILIPEDNRQSYMDAAIRLRDKTDGDIWLAGDRGTISLFLKHGLIDEITLYLLPLTLGSGRTLFPSRKEIQGWTLENCEKYANGVVQLRYTVKRSGRLSVKQPETGLTDR